MTFRLTSRKLRPDAELAGIRGEGIGAEALFVGVVRADRHAGSVVRALRYEAYAPLALREMGRLEKEARRRWGRMNVRVVHRTGVVRAGEASVVVAVGAPHRDAAFAACRYLIDRLKSEVPVWKSQERHGPKAARSGNRR